MNLYHYSLSYNGDKTLQNDYNKHFSLAEPMLLALRKSIDKLDNLVLSLLYLCRVYENCNPGEKSYLFNYEKNEVEAIFEYIRETEFPHNSVSRLNCVYYFRSVESAMKALYEDWIVCGDATKEEVKLLEVEVLDGLVMDYDQYWYNCAYDCMKEQNIEKVMEYARRYFSGTMSDSPTTETLCSSENHVLREIDY